MDEDIAIINTNTRNEKIKNFFKKNKKKFLILIVTLVTLLIIFFGYKEFENIKKIDVSNYYNSTIIGFSENTKIITTDRLIEIINRKDSTYSPLSLYFIIDEELITERKKINNLFNILIYETSLEKEIKNLIIFKKGLFNADQANENELLDILKPLINSDSVWSSHALHLIAEFFYSKNQFQKSKEFFLKIIELDYANQDIRIEAQKRLNRDLSD